MFTAVLVACLASAPTSCREHEIFIEARMPVAAFVEAQSLAAQWLAGHPGLVMKGLTLRAGRGG